MEQIKKQQIINTAMRIFKEKGYFAASMQDIAEACGMAKGSIYKVFPSKEDLFTGVFHLRAPDDVRASPGAGSLAAAGGGPAEGNFAAQDRVSASIHAGKPLFYERVQRAADHR
ncbi:TetR/AcrR family transcriptional regulator [Paenibacillus sp. AR247]|uniref:TetR/AcrR family transcriptional regulator n=1 Tax=Paenibacillus sp. AR247 TaxID=1631599 RepID=UPI0015E3DAC0|nr:helix-turn-helix domain-containing protein [Paenibacillus sp. AR247]